MSRTPSHPAGLLWALGAATVVIAARWHEIELHAGEIPFLDPWLVEVRQIILPGLEGKLTLGDFFRPHHEHWPMWTRLIAWLETTVLGQWNNQLQATINAVLMGGFVGLFAGWLRRSLPLVPALILTLLAVLLASLPHNWENIAWGFQAHMPLAVFFVFAYIQGSFTHPTGAAGWWLAQAAGLAALFTLGSMWAAPLAILLVLLWTTDWNWRRLVPAGLLVAVGVVLLLVARAHQPATGAATMGAVDSMQFFTALLRQLGWPSEWPGAALWINLPVLLLALRLRSKPASSAVDRVALAVALWAAAQATAFALARGSYAGFVSRYADLLALGVLANGVALWRLLQGGNLWSRLVLTILTVGWAWELGEGLRFINVQGHTQYFHEHTAQWSELRRAAIAQYLSTKDSSGLSLPETRAILFPDPNEVTDALDRPAFAALLPASVGMNRGRSRGDFFSESARGLRNYWEEFAYCGGLLLLGGLILTWKNSDSSARAEALPSTDKSRPSAVGLAAMAVGCGSLVFLWPQPFKFLSDSSWTQFIAPPGSLKDLGFVFSSETGYAKDRLIGGAELWPEDFRNTFFGTNVDGPAFTGTAQSSVFSLTAPSYIVPFAGYPASEGNSLLLRIEDAQGNSVEEIPCPGPNPGTGQTDVGYWEIDVRRHLGKNARLIIHDQRTETEAWVAVAPPYPGSNAEKITAAHRRFWSAAGTHSGLKSLQLISGALALLAVIYLFPPTRRLFC